MYEITQKNVVVFTIYQDGNPVGSAVVCIAVNPELAERICESLNRYESNRIGGRR